MDGDNRNHDALFRGGIQVVEVEVTAHQLVARSLVGTGKDTATGIVCQVHAFGSRQHVQQSCCHKRRQGRGAVNPCVQRFVEFVIHVVSHFVDTSLVALEVNERINHGQLVGVRHHLRLVLRGSGSGCGVRVVVAASRPHREKDHAAQQQGSCFLYFHSCHRCQIV